MKTRGPTLGLLPPLHGGISTLAKAGQHTRLIGHYLPAYAAAFSQVYYFSYLDETLAQFTNDAAVTARTELLSGDGGLTYTFKIPYRWAEPMRTCNVLRVFQITGAIPAAIARMRWGIPFVATYGYRYARFAIIEGRRRRAAALWLLEQLGLRTATRIIVTTPALAEYVRTVRAGAHVEMIPNGVDTNLFHPAPCLPGQRRVVFVGRLEPQKNLRLLFDALSRIDPRPALTVVGDGSLRAALVQAAAQISTPVEWAGVVANDQLPDLLRKADIFVLPSLIEGHPKALLEAMSCGLACVGLDVTGTREVLRHGETGLLCPSTAEGLSAGLRKMLDDTAQAERLGRSARAYIVENFDLARLIEREIGLLQSVAQRSL